MGRKFVYYYHDFFFEKVLFAKTIGWTIPPFLRKEREREMGAW